MAFTQSQLDALDEAIAAGTKVVMYEGKRVEYDTFDDLLRRRRLMADAIAGQSAGSQRPTGWNPGYERGT